MNDSHKLISEAYTDFQPDLVNYLAYRLNDRMAAEDIAQDAFMRALEWKVEIKKDTLHNLIFKIARNLMYDHMRRNYLYQTYRSQIEESDILYDTSTESAITVADILKTECRIMNGLPSQRRKVYILHRFKGKKTSEIADMMGISKRTAENHIFLSTKIIREYLTKCC